MLEGFLLVVHIVVAIFMILVVLVQGGNSGGVGAAFGGGNSSGVFGATGATSFLGKVTYGAAFVFMLTSISLSVIQGKTGRTGLSDRLNQATQQQTEEPQMLDDVKADEAEGVQSTEPAPTENN